MIRLEDEGPRRSSRSTCSPQPRRPRRVARAVLWSEVGVEKLTWPQNVGWYFLDSYEARAVCDRATTKKMNAELEEDAKAYTPSPHHTHV